MRVFIDVDLHQAIADFATKQPAATYTFKSQDTIDFQIYFVQAGVVQDYGSGFALKFGLIKTGDPANTILAYQTACTYLTDASGQVYYQMQVVMNTSQMATAIGTSPSMAGTIELRYQDALNEIIHTLNLAATIYATILVETGVTPPGVSTGYPDASTIELLVHKNAASGYAGLDSSSHLNGSVIPVDGQTVQIASGKVASAAILTYTSANFTTPASGGNVNVTCVSTAALKVGSYVRIPIAGYYIVEAVSGDGVTATLQNNGDPFNALSGTTITSGAVLLPAQAAAGGGGTGQGAYTATTAGFTIPAVGASVTIAVGSTAWMGGNGYAIFITGAGYFVVQSIVDATHVAISNSGSAANQLPGTNVATNATVSAAGPQGAAGAAGLSLASYDTLGASFVMPNAGASVNIQISNTAWVGTNQVIYIAGGGYFQVVSIINATNLSVSNLNYPGNAAAASTVPSGGRVSPAGLQGAQGAGGPGLNAFTTLSANFTQPAAGNTVTINVGTTAWMAVGQGIFVQGGGYYSVQSISDLTHAVVTNLGSAGNMPPTNTVTGSGTQTVSPAGIPGSIGTNAYTLTTAAFTTPAAGASVTVTVGATSWASIGQVLFIAGAGYYQVAAILSPTQFSLTNLVGYGNTSGGANIVSGASVSASGVIGPAGAAGPQGPAGATGSGSTIYTGSSLQGNGTVATPATLVADVAQGTNPNTVYQRNTSGNSVWAAIPTDGTTMTVTAGGTLKSLPPQESLGAHIETPTAKTYTVDLAASSAYTIKSFKCILGAGTCSLALQQNGSNVSGAGAISVSTTLSTTALTQAVAAGDKITIVLSSISSAADLAFTMYIQR